MTSYNEKCVMLADINDQMENKSDIKELMTQAKEFGILKRNGKPYPEVTVVAMLGEGRRTKSGNPPTYIRNTTRKVNSPRTPDPATRRGRRRHSVDDAVTEILSARNISQETKKLIARELWL